MDMTPAANLALRVAQRVGDKLVQQLDRNFQKSDAPLDDDSVRSLNDFSVALASEELTTAHPDDSIVTELDKNHQPGADRAWLIGLSGVENLRRGFPEFSILVSRFEAGAVTGMALYSPLRQEEFTAAKGNGCSFNGRRVRGSGVTSIENASLAGTEALGLGGAHIATGDTLRDLALAATARIDLAVALDLPAEYRTALNLMFTEAGHLTGDRNGAPISTRHTDLVAAPPKAFKLLIPALKQHLEA
jgi:myo-inositol-1(or 4)-monophosphatase